MPRPLDLLRIALVASSLAVAPSALHGQASPTASRLMSGQIGVGITLGHPDYTGASIKGGSIYGTLDFGRHLGIDGEIHDMDLFTPKDIGESSYLLGLRYHIAVQRFRPYVKVLGGIGRFQFQQGVYRETTSRSYKAFAVGVGTDYMLNRRVSLRGDLEFQHWFDFYPNGLTPTVGTIGAAYRF
ncbi:outer membrane beta-barrel protein [Granulicella sp. WH15]|uniref:outer membrane beta-barrel protein n=1 Tax=Granulicella sp. WH15 TaxID=2602070 RepID=UPI0013A55E02|nr:outer membrane beta-barrel protein [Granulicella sp. WH15]